MSSGIRSDASGTFGALTFGGDDAITFDATGIQAGSYKAGSIVDTDLTLSANSAPVKVALNAAGDAPIFACRAWVNFNGTGTVAIRASGNVSSITDNGTGDYTVNFTNAMPGANYAACFGSQSYNDSSGSGMVSLGISPSMTASGCRIYSITWSTGLSYRLDDKSFICASFFR